MTGAALKQARSAYASRDWETAREAFVQADHEAPLGLADLEALAWTCALTGRDASMFENMERLYHEQEAAGDDRGAARAAFWCGFRLFGLGERGRAAGWIARAERHIERAGGDCVEGGFVLLPAIHRQLGQGDPEGAFATAAEAIAIGERFGEHGLAGYARAMQGMIRLRQGRIREGIALLDDAMLAAGTGETSPIVTGLIYCTAIDCCHRVYAMDRMREWTAVLSEWCEAQPQLTTFTGNCLVHRAEIMEMHGDWSEAIEEAQRAAQRAERRSAAGDEPEALGAASYRIGELHRLRGAFEDAEAAYRDASRYGRDPQPGLALLRLAQGNVEAAASAIRRVVETAPAGIARVPFLPAHVEIMLAARDLDAARASAQALQAFAGEVESEALAAIAAHARGAVALAEGDAAGAIVSLREGFAWWQRTGAPYLAARIRVLIAAACRALGDEDGATLEIEAARAVFEDLGAGPDLARIAAPAPGRRPAHGLTTRELQVLRLVAGGGTNRAIARELFISERTVDRHVSNIFNKLDVSSRAAATARAYELKLV